MKKIPREIVETFDQALKEIMTLPIDGRTWRRLKEAAFFLAEMDKNYMKSVNFFYYLSAFILHSRTVLWVMKKEYTKVDGFKEWYDSKEATKGEKELLKRLTKLRNDAEKKGIISAHIKGIHSGEAYVMLTEEEFKKLGGKKELISEKKEELVVEFEDFPGRDIMEVCKIYFSFLMNIVLECLPKFGIQKEADLTEQKQKKGNGSI